MRKRVRFVASRSKTMSALLTVVTVSSLLGSCSSSVNATGEAQSSAEPVRWRLSIDTIGKPTSGAELSAWNVDVAADGRGLASGSDDVATDGRIYAANCAACHGAQGEGLSGDQLVGGAGTFASVNPKHTVVSY
ncbi:mono/diheme cytochrome c family protein [Paraburkholderia atlantica]